MLQSSLNQFCRFAESPYSNPNLELHPGRRADDAMISDVTPSLK
jgi:hypothetical protein